MCIAAAAKSLQSCLTLCDPIDSSPPGSPHPWDSPGKNTGVGCHFLLQCMKVKSESEVAQSCLTPSDPMDCSLPGSSVHGILQARVLEWGAIAFSKMCINFLEHHPCREGGQKEANVEKYGKPIENVFISCASTPEPVLWNRRATTTEGHTPWSLRFTRREAAPLRSPCTASREQPLTATAREKSNQQQRPSTAK